MPDKELIELIKKNPDKGLKILMSDYMGLICSIVREKLHTICDDFEMESCVSDVFIEFYQKIDRYSDDRGTIKALLCVIAKRKAIDVFRKKSKEFGNVCMDDEVYANTVKDKINLENEYILKEQKGQLIEAIKTLGEPDHEIIVRKYYLGESSRQISERLSLSVSAIDTRSSRALKKLKVILERFEEGFFSNAMNI